MGRKRLSIRNRRLREEINFKNRDGVRKDFFELLKRASKTTNPHS